MKILLAEVAAFNEARGWRSKHSAKDLAISVTVEAAELLELFQWKQESAVRADLTAAGPWRDHLESEVADVMIYLLSLCDLASVDPSDAIRKKLSRNEFRFPAADAAGPDVRAQK
jgi:NTP pyrophosphatase (non-canonical NTP hydrolase)